jgi:hypothetical protein
MRVNLLTLPLLCSASASLACSAPVSATSEGPTEASSSGSPSTAVVLIERTVTGGESARAEAVARFVRMRSGLVDDEALRLVGAATDFPPSGSCALLSDIKVPESVGARAVELVDVGTISVEANGGSSLSLLPRRLPDIVDLVSGVVYSTRASDPDSLPSDAAYVLRAGGRLGLSAGGDEFVPFVATAKAPAELGDLRIAGQDAKTQGGLALSSDAPVDVVWGVGSPDDTIYIDVAEGASSGVHSVRCTFGDVGHAVLSPATLADGDGTLAIHRLHREAFQARGIDSGEIRFDFARVVAFRR